MSDPERIARLEYVLGCLVSFLHGYLGTKGAEMLLVMLRDEDPISIPAFLRRTGDERQADVRID